MVRRQKYIAANNDKKSGTEEKYLELDSLVAAYGSIVCEHDISKGFEKEYDLQLQNELRDGAPDDKITRMGIAVGMVDKQYQYDSQALADKVASSTVEEFGIKKGAEEPVFGKAFTAITEFKERVRYGDYSGLKDHSSIEKGVSGVNLKLSNEAIQVLGYHGYAGFGNATSPTNDNPVVAGGECCIFNPAGGGGCGPCERGAGSELQIKHLIHDVLHGLQTKNAQGFIPHDPDALERGIREIVGKISSKFESSSNPNRGEPPEGMIGDSIDRANKAAAELNSNGYKIIEARDIVHVVPPEGYKGMEGKKVGEGDMRLISDTAGGTFRPIAERTNEGNYFKATKSINLQDTHYLNNAIQVTTDREARDNVKKVLTQQHEGGKGVVSNEAKAVGGGECCIFNPAGGGGCGPCSRGGVPSSSFLNYS
jgi:hypothetical protein